MFDLFNTAVALAEGAHLAHLKAYSLKFLGFITQRYDQETGLRSPNIMEAQAADRHLWFLQTIADRTHSMDVSCISLQLHDIKHVETAYMPRPFYGPKQCGILRSTFAW